MYGKFFASAFEGSMYGAGADVFAVWAYVIAHTVNARLEVNPKAVGPKIGMTPERVEKALAYLQAEDLNSRSKECEGRRMVKEGQFSYFIPNHLTYRDIKTDDDLREYNRKKKVESREKKKKKGNPFQNGSSPPGEGAYLRSVAAGASPAQLDKIVTDSLGKSANQPAAQDDPEMDPVAAEQLRTLTEPENGDGSDEEQDNMP